MQDTYCSSGGLRMTILEAQASWAQKKWWQGFQKMPLPRSNNCVLMVWSMSCVQYLEPFKVAAPLIFQMKPLNKDRFQLDTESDDFVFATASKKKRLQAKRVKAKCFGRSQGGEENYVSNHWEPEVQPGNEISRQQGDSARSYQTHER